MSYLGNCMLGRITVNMHKPFVSNLQTINNKYRTNINLRLTQNMQQTSVRTVTTIRQLLVICWWQFALVVTSLAQQ